MSSSRPPSIDPQAAARWQRLPLAASPWLHEEIGRRMDERLDWIKAQPAHWLDWQPLSGGLQAHRLLAARYPRAQATAIESPGPRRDAIRAELQGAWWRRAIGRDALALDMPADGSVNLLWANMALHASADPAALIAQWHALLATDGFVMFSCLGPDSLLELRALYAELGRPPPCHDFTDMHDWGDMLVGAGFAEPVMDMERLTLTYTTPDSLLADLRGIGRNLRTDRDARTHGRGWLAGLRAALAARMAGGAPFSLSFEVNYGHAIKPPPRVALQSQASVSLDAMRDMLRRPKSGGAP